MRYGVKVSLDSSKVFGVRFYVKKLENIFQIVKGKKYSILSKEIIIIYSQLEF